MTENKPSLIISMNFWTLMNKKNPDGSDWSPEQCFQAISDEGFKACSCPIRTPDLKASLKRHGLRFGGAFDAGRKEDFEPRIRALMEIDNGPINCQLGDHDTPVEEAVELTVALMEEADRQNAEVHLEVHRDTCTETPEKTAAILEGFRKIKGYYPRVNYDFSHPASFKHLHAGNYVERLFDRVEIFQNATLWHMRPFNGHHCQIPVTDGKGNFSPEYEEMRPFIRAAFDFWLQGPRPNNAFWVMPELGPKVGYGLSCFPDIWEDGVVLGHDLERIWAEALEDNAE